MRLRHCVLLSILLLPILTFAQGNVTGKNPAAFPGVPTGSCTTQQMAVNTATGDLYTCLNTVWHLASGTAGGTTTICSGSQALGTSAIASGAAATTVTKACTGLLSTDNIMLDFNGSPLAVTGYVPSATGILTIIKWPTADTINISVVNNTASSITPGAITLNYRVTR